MVALTVRPGNPQSNRGLIAAASAPAKDLTGKAPVPSAVHGAGRVPSFRASVEVPAVDGPADGPAVEAPEEGEEEGEEAAAVGGDHERCPRGKPTNIR